jgi:hypothetical protein
MIAQRNETKNKQNEMKQVSAPFLRISQFFPFSNLLCICLAYMEDFRMDFYGSLGCFRVPRRFLIFKKI